MSDTTAPTVGPAAHCSPPNDGWIPLAEIIGIIHHPNFYWGSMEGFTDCKYIELRIDTRDNCCVVRDRNHKLVDVAKLKAALEKPIMAGMNSNPQLSLK